VQLTAHYDIPIMAASIKYSSDYELYARYLINRCPKPRFGCFQNYMAVRGGMITRTIGSIVVFVPITLEQKARIQSQESRMDGPLTA
jgi:hypothetical protein